MMMPSVMELTYFVEVASTQNLTRAAKNLHISQPALTRAIKNLENTVGTELFIRHQKGVMLTRAGKKILLQTKPLLQHWQNTRLEARASHQNIEGNVRIGCHTTVGLSLHKILPNLLDKHLQLTFDIENAPSNIITQQVIDLKIDIGLVTNPIRHPDLIIKKLTDTETTLWTSTQESNIQNIRSNEAVIICNPHIPHTELILQKCKITNLKFKRILTVTSVEVIASLTANGCGIGILPSCFIQDVYPNRLKRIPKAPMVIDELYLIYRKEHMNVEAIKTTISAIKSQTLKQA